MKTTVNFINALPIANSANFEKNVIKLLPEGVEKIYLDACGMERASGYGSYNFFLAIEINGKYLKIKSNTNSSPSWDAYQDLETGTRNFENWIKATTLWLLEEKEDEIIELITSENE